MKNAAAATKPISLKGQITGEGNLVIPLAQLGKHVPTQETASRSVGRPRKTATAAG